jgi:antitoxin component YwqK of YwqJK toxin-antitoxin module
MARDYTKYNVEGVGENLNKRQLVLNIIKDYIEKNNPTLEILTTIFPDEIQGSKGAIRKESAVEDPKRFNMKEPLKIKNGMHIVVSNQWGGDNIPSFIEAAEKLGYGISFEEKFSDDIDSEVNLMDYPNDKDIIKEEFYQNGTLKSRERYIEGKEDDSICEYFHENGQPSQILILKALKIDGFIVDGTWKHYYDDDGQVRLIQNYKDGELHGVEERYSENGQLDTRKVYNIGQYDGLYEMYHENGKLSKKMFHINGVETGVWEYYDIDGLLEYTESYKDGKLDGDINYFDENGNLRDRTTWKDGVRISIGI